ncbi:MAG TPA: hypothetical protein DCE43_06130 [Planctomycetaceae bacterium]|nr:hypothetical protein [Planctomycetaceae bacterium]HCK53218.1 hypothetical protein [Planctomycetaceae bacterium]
MSFPDSRQATSVTTPSHQTNRQVGPSPTSDESACVTPACPVCGGQLIEIRHKLTCSRCHAICETCCEGGRG